MASEDSSYLSSRKRPHEDDECANPSKRPSRSPLVDDRDLSQVNSHTSSSTPEASQDPPPESAELTHNQKGFKYELNGATHESASLCTILCPDPDNRAAAILDKLRKDNVYQLSHTNTTVSIPGWPNAGLEDRAYYAVLVDLLNAIIDAFQQLFPDTKSYYVTRGVRFHVYGREMAEIIDDEYDVLKPGFIASANGPFPEGKNCSWYDVDLMGEAKDTWDLLIVQCGLYAQCCFAAADNRFFAPVLSFNHAKSEFRICFFHRGGLLATTGMNLLTRDGFESFVSAITGMWSSEDGKAAGHCPSQSHSHFSIHDTLYQIDHLFFRRDSVRGRGTRVFALVRELEGEFSPGPPPYLIENFKRVGENIFEPLLRPHSARPEGTAILNDGASPLPEHVAVKCSFPLASQTREELVFQPAKGYIGVVDVLGVEDAPCVTPPPDATFWEVWESDEPKGESVGARGVELRVHRHLLFGTLGYQLRKVTGPRELGYAILHAMIGHFAVFTRSGYVHRDVSTGNILLLRNTEQRLIPPGLEDIVTSTDCFAVLSDGDAARKWGESRDPSTHRSGTRPFISERVIDCWKTIGDEPVLHTPIDDLESFIWVLYLTLLEMGVQPNNQDKTDLRLLMSDNLAEVSGVKSAILTRWGANGHFLKQSRLSPRLRPFYNLLLVWFTTAWQCASSLKGLLSEDEPSLDAISQLCIDAYRRYIHQGVEHAAKLPQNWDEA